MSRVRVLTVAALSCLWLTAQPAPGRANPVLVWLGGQLLGELVVGVPVGLAADALWDNVTGAPNVHALQKRLEHLEANAALRGDVRQKLRDLRQQIDARVTREEFQRLARQTLDQISEIEARVKDLELSREEQEVQIRELRGELPQGASKDPELFRKRGQDFLASGQHWRSLANYDLALKLAEGKASLHVARAHVYRAMRADEVAVVDLGAAIRLDPKYTAASRERALVYARLNRRDEAIADWTRVIELDPDNPYNYLDRARLHGQAFRHDQVVADCTRALELNPNLLDAYGQRGYALVNSRQADRALPDFTRLVEANPNDSWALGHRGVCHLRGDEPAKALDDLTRAARLDANQAWWASHKAEALNQLGRHAEAAADADRALQLDGNHYNGFLQRAVAHHRQNNLESALGDYNRALNFFPAEAQPYLNRAAVNRALFKLEAAENDLTTALQFEPNNTHALAERMEVRYARFNYSGTVADADAVLGWNPSHSQAYFRRAEAQSSLGNRAAAIADYGEVIRLTGDAMAYNNRAVEYRLNGEYAKCVADCDAALQADPNNQYAHFNRGVARRLLGQTAQAEADLTQALNSTDAGIKESAIDELARTNGSSQALLNALPANANAFGQYGTLLRRWYAAGDRSDYGDYSDRGYWTTSSWRGHDNLPSGYWVYSYPNWYIWSYKKN